MNDLELIARLDDSREPDPAVLARGLARLEAGIREADQTHMSVGPAPRPGMRGRAGLALVAAAAAVALVVALIQDGPSDDGGTARNRPTAPPSSSLSATAEPTPSGTGPAMPPPAEAEVASFMRRAAAVAAVAVTIEPRPDQYLYVSDGNGYEAWLSIDGTRDGEVRNASGPNRVAGCVDGIAQVEGNAPAPRPQPCVPLPAFLPDAPTGAQAMADYLIAAADPPTEQEPVPAPTPNQLGKRLLSLLEFSWLLPPARAALFDSLPLLPGLDLTVNPVPGQPSTAVSWTFSGAINSLLFDTSTLEYVGFLSTPPDGTPPSATSGPTVPLVSMPPSGTTAPPQPGTPTATVMTQRIVDQVGDRA